jgi:hypothetical protein
VFLSTDVPLDRDLHWVGPVCSVKGGRTQGWPPKAAILTWLHRGGDSIFSLWREQQGVRWGSRGRHDGQAIVEAGVREVGLGRESTVTRSSLGHSGWQPGPGPLYTWTSGVHSGPQASTQAPSHSRVTGH